MELLVFGEAVRSPSFVDEGWTGEMLENRLGEVPGNRTTAQAVIGVELGVEGAAAALLPVLVLPPALRLLRLPVPIKSL